MNRPTPLEELLQGCLNGTLSEAEERDLARLLRESPEARSAMRSQLLVEAGLLTLALAQHLSGGQPVAAGLPRTTPVRNLLTGRRLVFASVLAASVLLLIVALGWFSNDPAPSGLAHPGLPPVVARLVEADGKVEIVAPTGAVRPAAARDPLLAGESLRTGEGGSVAVVEFADATRLELSPETSIRLPDDGSRGVQLIQGVVRGHEGAQAPRSPIVVTTPAARVLIEGDRFHLSSTSPDRLRVEMDAGKAEVVRESDHKSLTVKSGAAVLVQPDAEDMAVGSMPRFATEPKRFLDFPGAWAVFFEADGKHMLAASAREMQRFGPEAPPEKTTFSTDKHQGRLAAFSDDGKTLATYRGLHREDPVILWDMTTRQQRVRVDARITDRRFALAPDASWLATVDRDETPATCRVWDGQTGGERFAVRAEPRVECVAASPDGGLLAVGVVDLGKRERNKVLLVDAGTGREVATLPTRAAPLTVLSFSPDGHHLAAGITGSVQVWDVDKKELLRTIRGFERVLLTLTYSPDGALLAGGTQDGQVWVWDAESGEPAQVIQAGTSGVRVLNFAPDGRVLATGGIKHHPLMLWEVPPRRVRPEGPGWPAKS